MIVSKYLYNNFYIDMYSQNNKLTITTAIKQENVNIYCPTHVIIINRYDFPPCRVLEITY